MKMLLSNYMYQHDLTERQVAYLTGVPKTTIHRIVTGETIPRLDTLEQIAVGLDIHITDLFESDYK